MDGLQSPAGPGTSGSARAVALLGRELAGVTVGAEDRRWAAGLLHDLVVWGLDSVVDDTALRPVEGRLGRLAVELAADDPGLATLLDWWVAAVVGLRPAQLWYTYPLPEEVAAAILPGGWPPNLGAEVKARRYGADLARLRDLATTVPVLSQVTKAQSVVRVFNAELQPLLDGLEARQPDRDAARRLAERAEATLRPSGVVEGTPLHAKVRRELEERAHLAADLAARAGELDEAFKPLPANRVKALARQVKSGDPLLAGRLLAALGGPAPRPDPAGLAVALANTVGGLPESDRFFAHRLVGGVAAALADATGDRELAAFAEEGGRAEAEVLAILAPLEPHATGDAADVSNLVRAALEAGELTEARAWLTDLSATVAGERARREAGKALDRARNRGVGGDLVDGLDVALQNGDTESMNTLVARVRLLPGMDRRLSALAASPPTTGPPAGSAQSVLAQTGEAPAGAGMLARGGVERGWPERLEPPAVVKATPAYVVRVNAHNRFFDGTICAAPAGNRNCQSSERFKLDFCEQGVRRCAWLGAFAAQPRMEITDPFIEEYLPIVEETPPEAGDVAVLWAATEDGNELVGLWRVLTLAPARRGWVLNGDRDAAVLIPRGAVPFSAVYRRWSSPRGSQAMRTLDATGLEGLLVEVRERLAPLADADPSVQRDIATLEVLLADQRARSSETRPTGDANGSAVTTAAPVRTRRRAGAPGPVEASVPAVTVPAAEPVASPGAALHARLRATGGFYPAALVAQYELAVAESRLVVLAGPSGTGKTRLAADAATELGAAFCLVAVRPDWHANEDLLGYLPPFPGARFQATPAAAFLRAAAVEGDAATAQGRPARPFHLCLDEMNLARPEHYLAELLSKMELTGGRVAFHTQDDEASGFPAEVTYPANLVVVGTVNLDESTQPISAKVLDRAAYLIVEAHELRAFLDHLPESKGVPGWVGKLLVDLDGSLDDAGQGLGYRVAARLVRWTATATGRGHGVEEALDWGVAAQVVPRLRFTRTDPAHLEVLEAVVGRLRSAPGGFPRSLAVLERMLSELRRQDFTLGQLRLS